MDHFECKSTSKPTNYLVTAFIFLYLLGNYYTIFAMCVQKNLSFCVSRPRYLIILVADGFCG